jgi:hypothetical protein
VIGTRQRWLAVAFALQSLSPVTQGPQHLARRCSLVVGRSAPAFTPAGLVASAAVILRVRADSAVSAVPRPSRIGQQTAIHFTVIEVIDSGRITVPPAIAIPGQLTNVPDFNTGAIPYTSVRSDGLRGACYAYAYQKGGEFLLLLRGTTIDSLTPYWEPLRPTNEQVRGPNDPWVEWVRTTRRALNK